MKNHATACVTSLVATALLPVILASLVGCESATPAVRGSGVLEKEPRDASGFSQVWLSGSGEVFVERSGSESVTVEAEDNILPLLETRVRDGRLTLGTKRNVNIRPTRPIRYHVTVKELTAIGVSGSGRFRVEGVDASHFTADISGSGDATVSGRADEVRLRISGSGDYDGAKLVAKIAKVDISGSGSATVNAGDRLEANVTGSGSVRYLGSPTVDKHVSGSGSVATVSTR